MCKYSKYDWIIRKNCYIFHHFYYYESGAPSEFRNNNAVPDIWAKTCSGVKMITSKTVMYTIGLFWGEKSRISWEIFTTSFCFSINIVVRSYKTRRSITTRTFLNYVLDRFFWPTLPTSVIIWKPTIVILRGFLDIYGGPVSENVSLFSISNQNLLASTTTSIYYNMYDLGFTLRLYVRSLCWVSLDFFQKFYGGLLFFTSAWLLLLKLKILSAGDGDGMMILKYM